MQGLGHKIAHGFLVISLLLNLTFISIGFIFFKTHALDLPLIAIILNKNCDQGLDKLIPLPNPDIAAALSTKFCTAKPQIQNSLPAIPKSPL